LTKYKICNILRIKGNILHIGDDFMRDDIERELLFRIFQVSNSLQTFIDKDLNEKSLTAKQFYLMIVIGNIEEQPTFSNIAKVFGSSRQNVKQLALKLEKGGFVEIKVKENDHRTRLITLTKKANDYFINRDNRDIKTMKHVFADITTEQLRVVRDSLEKIFDRVKGE